MNYRKTLTYRDIAEQAQKLSEMAYLEAMQPKHLRNQVLIDHCFIHAKRLTNHLVAARYWEKSMISVG